VAEFLNAWLKEKLGLRWFRVRGLAKVRAGATWAALTYNVQQWIKLRWRPSGLHFLDLVGSAWHRHLRYHRGESYVLGM
jgi:hypothetical protein